MASHYIAIAKASFTASLLKPDPAAVPRDEIARFHTLLDSAITQCTPSNVQSCKDWIVQSLAASSARTGNFGKYLVALSTSFAKPPASNATSATATDSGKPSVKRKQLHVLYLLNDVLHHTKYHLPAIPQSSIFAGALQPHLLQLFTLPASHHRKERSKHVNKLEELLQIWQANGYYTPHFVDKLRQPLQGEPSSDVPGTEAERFSSNLASSADPAQKTGKETAYMMPATHGDPSTPFYDLPAGNLLPFILPNSTVPIKTQEVRPLEFVAGPADASLALAVKDFMKDVDHIYNLNAQEVDQGIIPDIDEMGQTLVRDEMTGELAPADAYYGWSVPFCQRMMRVKRGEASFNVQGQQGNGGSSPDARRRYSSADESRSRSRTRSRSRDRRPYRRRSSSRSRSRSSSRPGFRTTQRRSPARSRSPPPRFIPNAAPAQAPPASARPSMPQPTRSFHLSLGNATSQPFATPIDQISDPFATLQPAAPAPPELMSHNFPLGPNGLPLPPPPPFHSGPWPPPPPPPGPGGLVVPPAFARSLAGAALPPPQPLPPAGLAQSWGGAGGVQQPPPSSVGYLRQGYAEQYGVRDGVGSDRGGMQARGRDPRRRG